MKRFKKFWIIGASTLGAVLIALAVLLAVFIPKNKKSSNNLVSSNWVLDVSNTNLSYFMGDKFDISGLKFNKYIDGVLYSQNVSWDMLVLPESGVDSASGLNNKGYFLEHGEKNISISAFGLTYNFQVFVQEDAIVSLHFPSDINIKLVDGMRIEDVYDKFVLLARTSLGRVLVLDKSMFSISAIEDLADQPILQPNSILVKTYEGAISQDVRISVNYKFVFGENLPLASDLEKVDIVLPAKLIENNVQAVLPTWAVQDLYRSVVSRTDFAQTLYNTYVDVVYANGDTSYAFFSDGKYVFQIEKLILNNKTIFAYKFVLNEGRIPTLYDDTFSRQAFVFKIDNIVFSPFGKDYSLVEYNGYFVPSSAEVVGVASDNSLLFIPNEDSYNNLVFFAENITTTNVSISMSWLGLSEEYIFANDYSSSIVVTPNYSINKSTIRQNQFFVLTLNSVEYFVEESVFFDFLGDNATFSLNYYHNYGFADQSKVNYYNGLFYFENGDLVDVPNITERMEYFDALGNLIGYSIFLSHTGGFSLSYLGDSVLAQNPSGEFVTVPVLSFGNSTPTFVLKFVVNDIKSLSSQKFVPVSKNTVVNVVCSQIGPQEDLFVGELITLDGFAFILTLENGDVLNFNADKTCVVFETLRNWSYTDFVVDQVNAFNYLNSSVVESYAKKIGQNISFLLNYVGFLAGENQVVCSVFSNYNFLADPIISISLIEDRNFLVSGSQNQFLIPVLNSNVAEIVLFSGRTFSRFNFAIDQNFDFVPTTLTIVVSEDMSASAGLVSSSQFGEKPLNLIGGAFAEIPSDSSLLEDFGHFSIDVIWFYSGNVRQDDLIGVVNPVYYSNFVFRDYFDFDGELFNFSNMDYTTILQLVDYNSSVVILDSNNLLVSEVSLKQFFEMPLIELVNGNLGDYVALVYKNNQVVASLFYTIVQNDIAGDSDSFQIIFDRTGTRLFANGLPVSIADFNGVNLGVLLISGQYAISHKQLNGIEYVTLDNGFVMMTLAGILALDSNYTAPSYKQSLELGFIFLDTNYNWVNFSNTVTFFVKHNPVSDIVANDNSFKNESFLDDFTLGADYAFYQKPIDSDSLDYIQSYMSLQKYIDPSTSLYNAIQSFKFTAFSKNLAGSSISYSNFMLTQPQIVMQNSKYYLSWGDNLFEIEEDYIEYDSFGQAFARVVVNDIQMFVKINLNFNPNDPSSSRYLDFYPISFVIDVSNNLSGGWTTAARNIQPQQLETTIFQIARTYNSVASFVRIYAVFFDGLSDSKNSQAFTLYLPAVPFVSNPSLVTSSTFVENQVLSLGDLVLSNDELSQINAQNYQFTSALGSVSLVYNLGGFAYSFSLAQFLDNFKFIEYSSSGIVETSYSITDSGSAIRLGNLPENLYNFTKLRFVFSGIEFFIQVEIINDHVVFASLPESIFVVENQSIFENVLNLNLDMVSFASGKPVLYDVDFDNLGTAELSNCKLVFASFKNNELWKAFDAKSYSLAELLDFSGDYNKYHDNIFSFDEYFGKDCVSYRIYVQLDDVVLNVDDIDLVLSSNFSNIYVEPDLLINVDNSMARTEYYIFDPSIGYLDSLSLMGFEFFFQSGLNFLIEQNVREFNLFLQMLPDASVVLSQTKFDDSILLESIFIGNILEKPSLGLVVNISHIILEDEFVAQFYGYTSPVATTRNIDIVFNCGGQSFNVEIVVNFVPLETSELTISLLDFSSIEFVPGTIISISDIRKFIDSVSIKVTELFGNNDIVDLFIDKNILKFATTTNSSYQIIDEFTIMALDGFSLLDIIFTID